MDVAGDVCETYLRAIGDNWMTQELSTAPAIDQPIASLVHYDANGGLTYTSVYTADAAGNLQATYLDR